MRVNIFPVVILAAGHGRRIKDTSKGLNKALLKIDENHNILDFIFFNLIKNGITKIVIIAGYNSNNIMEYCNNIEKSLKNKPIFKKILKNLQKVEIIAIEARKEYRKGPLYTLSTLANIIECEIGEKEENIRFSSDYYTIIPSDTIFEAGILKEIFNIDINIENETLMKKKNEITPICHTFALNREINELNFDNGLHFNILPITVASKNFILQSEKFIEKGYKKIIDQLDVLYKEKKNKIHFINYKGKHPPFFDIDTGEDLIKIREIVFNK